MIWKVVDDASRPVKVASFVGQVNGPSTGLEVRAGREGRGRKEGREGEEDDTTHHTTTHPTHTSSTRIGPYIFPFDLMANVVM